MAQEKTPQDNNWTIVLENFHVGAAPIAHLDSLTEIGNGGHFSVASEIDVTVPKFIKQGPALTNLTNGTQAGIVNELINYILDIPPVLNTTYGISNTKLFKILPDEVVNSSPFPYTITGATKGESLVAFQGNLYYFYNKTGGGDIGKYDFNVTFDDDWGSTVPTGAGGILNAKHPVATKEDIMVFGNGRYLGTFFSDSNTLVTNQLDFGANTEVADVAFYSNQWLIAVNEGVNSVNNRSSASLYLWEAGALDNLLSDEISVGIQEIGFIKVFGGTIYVCYRDIAGNNIIGYVSGRTLTPLVYFSGSLPDYKQKTVYKGFIQTISSGKVLMAGAATPDFSFSLSPFTSTGHETGGAIAVPFGKPLVSSTEDTSYRLAKMEGLSGTASWQSIIFPVSVANSVGYIDSIVVNTNNLSDDALCKLTIKANQNTKTSDELIITGENKQRHSFPGNKITLKEVEDFSIKLDWGHSDPCIIRKIIIKGHWINKS